LGPIRGGHRQVVLPSAERSRGRADVAGVPGDRQSTAAQGPPDARHLVRRAAVVLGGGRAGAGSEPVDRRCPRKPFAPSEAGAVDSQSTVAIADAAARPSRPDDHRGNTARPTARAVGASLEQHRPASFRTVRRTGARGDARDRKSTRLNSSHVKISYAVFCLKKKRILYIL